MSTPQFEAPASITALGSNAAGRVAGLVRNAEHRLAEEGAAAAESSLKLVPRPFRPLIRKVLGL